MSHHDSAPQMCVLCAEHGNVRMGIYQGGGGWACGEHESYARLVDEEWDQAEREYLQQP